MGLWLLCLLTWLTISFSMYWKFSTIISSKILFFSSSGSPIIQMLVHLLLSQRSLRLSSVLFFLSFFLFFCTLLFRSYFQHFVFQLSDPFFCFWYSALIPYRVFLISVIVAFVSVCLFFNYSRSLLNDSYIFSILFSKFLIIFTIIILNSFSGGLSISSSFIWTFVFLVCSLICVVFPAFLLLLFFNLLCLRSSFPRLQV